MKGLKYITSVLPFVFFLIFTSCSEDKPTIQVGPRGIVEGDIFTDDRYGLEFTIPEGWEVDDTSQYDMNTILRLNYDDNNNFIFASEPLLPAQHIEDYFNEKYRLVKSRSSLASIFGARNMSGLGTYTADINDVEFNLISYRYKKEEIKGKLMYGQYFLQTGRDVIKIRTVGELKIIDELKSSINKVDFASLPPADDSQVTIDRDYYQEGIKSPDSDGYFSLYEHDMKIPTPENYRIKRNIYADGWSTRLEKDDQNHIVVTERLIDKGLSFDAFIEKKVQEMNTSFGEKIVKLRSRKISGKEYDYFNLDKATITGLMMEGFKEEFIKKNSKEEYEKEYEKTIQAEKGSGFIVFMREVNGGEFLNVELTYTNEESQNGLIEMIEGIRPLGIQ